MLKLNVKSNVKQWTKGLDSVSKKQVPFATARALTRTAQQSQADIIGAIPKIFNNNRKWWLKQQPTGVKIQMAKKTDLEAVVYTNAYFAAWQEEGGIKLPFTGGGILVPTLKVPKYGRKAGGAAKVMAGKTICRMGGKPGGSPIIKMKTGKRGVFRRKGKKKIELLYNYVPQAHINARFGFKKMAHQSAKKNFETEFNKSLKAAIRTAK